MGLFSTKNKGDLRALKKELITVVDSFFIPYKANFGRISSSIDVLSGSIQELEVFKKKLDKLIDKKAVFPELISKEKMAEINSKVWGQPKPTQLDVDAASILEKEINRLTK